jgi:uncharacterized membrane protein YozB (DUF420 family)
MTYHGMMPRICGLGASAPGPFCYNKDMKAAKILAIVFAVIIVVLLAVLFFYPIPAKTPTMSVQNTAPLTATSTSTTPSQ